jgi:hypothetical protein
MEQTIRRKKIRNRFYRSLQSATEEFRKGNDHQGLDGFLNCMEDLESLLDINRSVGADKIELDGVLPILQELFTRIENRDITGMTDIMEFSLYPMVKELAGADGNENCEAG